jgi:hypothetical protein
MLKKDHFWRQQNNMGYLGVMEKIINLEKRGEVL